MSGNFLVCRLLVDALEKSLKYTPGENICKELYQGF
jgi:hypothetical protein